MKSEFDNFSQQMGYINKMVLRNTDLKKICQYCGKPAQIRYSHKHPFDIQFICAGCKRKYQLNKYKDLIPDLEVIHIKEHFNDSKKEREEKIELNETNMKKIQELFKSKLPKMEAVKEVGLTLHNYYILLEQYKKIEPDIEDRLNKLFSINRSNKVRKASFGKMIEIKDNNLARLKKERNISNREIVKLSNNQIQICALSNISTGKTKPTIKTKCLLADIFKVSVADIFPKEWLFSNIYNYEDYIKLNTNIRVKLLDEINKRRANNETYVIDNIAKQCNLPVFRLYDFLRNKDLFHDELVLLVSNIY